MKSSPCTDVDNPLGLQEFEAPRFSRQLAHEGGKVVSPTHRQPLRPGEIFLVLISVRVQSNPGPQCDQKG